MKKIKNANEVLWSREHLVNISEAKYEVLVPNRLCVNRKTRKLIKALQLSKNYYKEQTEHYKHYSESCKRDFDVLEAALGNMVDVAVALKKRLTEHNIESDDIYEI